MPIILIDAEESSSWEREEREVDDDDGGSIEIDEVEV